MHMEGTWNTMAGLEFVWLVFILDLCSLRTSDEPVVLICVVVLLLLRAYSSTAFVLL